MVSAVNSRPNHYELLGLTPRAAGDSIAEAFVKATNVLRPHAFGSMAEICLAYQTLRDPARRRAYDASIGLKPEPILTPASRPASAHFMALPAVGGMAEPKVEPSPAQPIVQGRPIQLDAPSPRQPAYNEINVGVGSIEWKRTGAMVGGLVAAAVLVGALAGWWSGSSAVEPERQVPSTATAATHEKPPPSFSELWSGPATQSAELHADPPSRASTRKIERIARRPHPDLSEPEATLIQPPSDLADPAPMDSLAPQADPAPALAASMPLPHRTVARTIDRIGYSCGSVTSTTPVEGAAGVYTVICTSGQSFQAKPVNGRYRFRRLAGN